MFINNYIALKNRFIIKKSIIILKRVFIFLSIYLLTFYKLIAQDISFSDPYSEKLLFSPAYSGLSKCSKINLTYNKKFSSNYYSSSFNKYFDKYKSGIGLVVSNNSQGNRSISDFYLNIIYSYKIIINRKKIINTAFELSYFQQNINPQQLIFNNQINPVTSNVVANNNELFFEQNNGFDFSSATTFISTKYRIGIVFKHIDKVFLKRNKTNISPAIKVHLARTYKLKESIFLKKATISPEFIYNFQNNYSEITYGIHLVNNIFLTRLFIKHNLRFNTISPIITIGIPLRNITISYSYKSSFNKFISYPNSSNQLSLAYRFNCSRKRNFKKTIFCPNF